MATRNIVPRATGEGQIGTSAKTWGAMYANDISATGAVSAGSVSATGAVSAGSVSATGAVSAGSINTLQRETAYNVDDIVYTSELNARYYLLCVTAGTTASTLPSFSGATSNTQITDGTVVWRVQTVTSQEKAETYTDVRVSAAVPTGCVQAFAGRTTPQGWLLCDGSAVSRTDYAALYAVIGTTYGAGNGSTTFNLPNLVDKFVEGSATAGTVKSAGLPNITGDVSFGGIVGLLFDSAPNFSVSGAFYGNLKKTGGTLASKDGTSYSAGFNASRSSSIYGNSTTVQPPALTMRYIIKY